MSQRMYPDDVDKKNRGFLGYDSWALPPRVRQVSTDSRSAVRSIASSTSTQSYIERSHTLVTRTVIN